MPIQSNVPLAPMSSLGTGGAAELLANIVTARDIEQIITEAKQRPSYILGYLTNTLVSDEGLLGLSLMLRGGEVSVQGETLICDAGVWWDDAVKLALEHHLWGIECMSGIPSSVGAAVVGNIAAYGQQVSDHLAWIEVYDLGTNKIYQLNKNDIEFTYRESSLQKSTQFIVTKVIFNLAHSPTMEVNYDSAKRAAETVKADLSTLAGRRDAVMEARRVAGSLYEPGETANRTAGSFFKNPMVDEVTARQISAHDETGKSLERLLEQNVIHGGNASRVSAAHVLLAAGYKRGQSWGNVRLHPDHILKLENTGGASSQEIYTVAHEIIKTVHDKLGIELEPEVKFLGRFKD